MKSSTRPLSTHSRCCLLQTMEASGHGCSSVRTSISTSLLCQPDDWPDDVDTLAASYDSVLTNILDTLMPVRHFIRHARPSDAWFGKECRDAKPLTRALQRRYTPASVVCLTLRGLHALARETWYHQRRLYRLLVAAKPLGTKASDFWRSRL